jgi:hypothetical protein
MVAAIANWNGRAAKLRRSTWEYLLQDRRLPAGWIDPAICRAAGTKVACPTIRRAIRYAPKLAYDDDWILNLSKD